jgi:hypothetical protein
MSDTEKKTVRATVTRDFNDAGTERRFAKGETPDLSEGEFANYQAAGLVEVFVEEPAAADAGDPAKTGRTRG